MMIGGLDSSICVVFRRPCRGVNNYGHSTAFAVGGAMAYGGLSPLFSSGKFTPPPPGHSSESARMDLVDLLKDRKDKLYVGLGAASTTLVLESLTVVVKRFIGSE